MILRIFVFLGAIVISLCGPMSVSKSSGHPVFFLQDPSDGKCLSDGSFKRCSIKTLWHIEGKPGMYQIHRRLNDLDVNDDEELCLVKEFCHLDDSAVVLGSCGHCGASKWNILGDAHTG
jgi:hypothetical protein